MVVGTVRKIKQEVPPFKQIAVGTSGLIDSGEVRDWVYGLDYEGRVWMFDHDDGTWVKLTTDIFGTKKRSRK